MVSHALFHQWPGATHKTKDPRSFVKTLRLHERRLALVESLSKKRSAWMTEEAAAAEHHPTLLEDNPSSG